VGAASTGQDFSGKDLSGAKQTECVKRATRGCS
jgi:hypothetical protein